MSSGSDKPWQNIVLASASPRRQELLQALGLRFQVVPAEVDESSINGSPPHQYVKDLAGQKAMAVARHYPKDLVIGADTVVVLDDMVLGKPASPEDARDMLTRLSGNTHQVFTGVALVHHATGAVQTAVEVTSVTFGPLSYDKIDRYVKTGEPMDKAGAYGIQGLGALLVQRIDGCYFNVVGLPLYILGNMLSEWGCEIP